MTATVVGARIRAPSERIEKPRDHMAVFEDSAFDDHERVIFCRDAHTGLQAIIAITQRHWARLPVALVCGPMNRMMRRCMTHYVCPMP